MFYFSNPLKKVTKNVFLLKDKNAKMKVTNFSKRQKSLYESNKGHLIVYKRKCFTSQRQKSLDENNEDPLLMTKENVILLNKKKIP